MTISKYRKKPIEVKAVLWDGSTEALNDIRSMISSNSDTALYPVYYEVGDLSIHTLEGVMSASKGDYVIQGIKGELYPCKPDIFEATYEVIE